MPYGNNALAIDVPDIAGAYMMGRQMHQRNALEGAMQQYGAAAMQGDQNALAQIAQYDPQYAMRLQAGQQDMRLAERADARAGQQLQISQENLTLAREQGRRAAETHAAQMDATTRAREAEEVKNFAVTADRAWQQGPEAFAGFMAQYQEQIPEEFRGLTYDDAPYAISMVTGMAEGFGAGGEDTVTLGANERLVGKQTGREIVGAAPAGPQSPEGKLQADIAAGLVNPTANYDYDAEMDLRKEWTGLPQVKDFQTQTTAFGRIASSAQDPSAAGDLALIFSFMKILDPASVVRETEFANAQNAAGIPDQVRNVWNRALSGERLAPAQREDFLRQAKKLYDDSAAQVGGLRSQYEPIATARSLDPSRALPDYAYTGELPPLPQQEGSTGQYPGAPAVGAVVEDHRFKGGNPNDQANWELVR